MHMHACTAPSRNLDDERCRNGRRREASSPAVLPVSPFFPPCNFAAYSFVSCEPQGFHTSSECRYVRTRWYSKDFCTQKISIFSSLPIHTVIFLALVPCPSIRQTVGYLSNQQGRSDPVFAPVRSRHVSGLASETLHRIVFKIRSVQVTNMGTLCGDSIWMHIWDAARWVSRQIAHVLSCACRTIMLF